MLSKQFNLSGGNFARVVYASSIRQAHQSAVEKAKVKPEEMDNPGFFQKIILRFKGIPLKGEKERPRALLDDIGKYHQFPPLPQVPKDYKEFPERDLVKFPFPNKPEYTPKTRFLVVPDSWCREIEKITGTSGPYLAFGTFFLFLINKEILVADEHFLFFTFSWLPYYILFHTAFRIRMERAGYRWYREWVGEKQAFIDNELKEAVEFRKTSKAQTESLKAAKENFPTIFQENLALQLEANYRKNVDYAWGELKRRLDYLQEVQATKERFTKEILLKTITEGVRKQIDANEAGIRDKYLDQCIEQLRGLAPK